MTALVSRYRGIVCDLDGVVYRGGDAVPEAVPALTAVRSAGVGIIYATNNASRTPETVFEHLRDLGISLDISDVVTSAMAGAAELSDALEAGSVVLAVGGDGVAAALTGEGLHPVRTADVQDGAEPVAVLQGYGRDVAWTDLAEAGFVIQGGARWVATNGDLTVPTARGIAPGNGSLVAALRHAVAVDPLVVGKPHPPLYLRCAERLGCEARETLAVGDRLDTDIEGAVRTGMDSLCVLTGVSGPTELILAGEHERPTYVAYDMRALTEPYLEPRTTRDGRRVRAKCGDAHVVLDAGGHDLGEGGTASERLRALVAAGRELVGGGATLPDLHATLDWIRSAA